MVNPIAAENNVVNVVREAADGGVGGKGNVHAMKVGFLLGVKKLADSLVEVDGHTYAFETGPRLKHDDMDLLVPGLSCVLQYAEFGAGNGEGKKGDRGLLGGNGREVGDELLSDPLSLRAFMQASIRTSLAALTVWALGIFTEARTTARRTARSIAAPMLGRPLTARCHATRRKARQ